MRSKPFNILILIIIAALFLSGCGSSDNNTPTNSASPNNGEPGEVIPTTVSVPDPAETAKAYLNAWNENDRPSMYNLLTTVGRDA